MPGRSYTGWGYFDDEGAIFDPPSGRFWDEETAVMAAWFERADRPTRDAFDAVIAWHAEGLF